MHVEKTMFARLRSRVLPVSLLVLALSSIAHGGDDYVIKGPEELIVPALDQRLQHRCNELESFLRTYFQKNE